MLFVASILLLDLCFSTNAQLPIQLNVNNWTQILTDEWLVEFFAPWCPACQLLAPEWNQLATIAPEMGIKIAQIDCSSQSSVATIFTITTLPTIFHIKDGVFRIVKGKRRVNELQQFIETRSYQLLEPEVWPYSPNAFYMPFIVRFLDLGMSVIKLHTYMISKGMPASLSFIIVGSAILGSGASFGMFLLCICEYCCLPRPGILRLVGMGGEPPEPIVTKENDTDQDSVLDESPTEVKPTNSDQSNSSEGDQKVHRRKPTTK